MSDYLRRRQLARQQPHYLPVIILLTMAVLMLSLGIYVLLLWRAVPVDTSKWEVHCESGEEHPSQVEYTLWESDCKLDDGTTLRPIRVYMVD